MYRRRLLETFAAAIAAAALIVAPLAALSPAAAADTVVSSEDFSDGSLDATWGQNGNPTLAVAGGVLEVSNRTADYDGIQSAAGLLEAGKTYTFSVKLKLADGTVGTPGARLVVNDGAYNWIGNTTISAAGWTTITASYTPAAAARVYIGTDNLTGPYTYLVDDLLITTPAPATDTTLTSEDFGDGVLDPTWQQSGNPALTVAGGVLQVANRANDYDGISTAPGVLEAGKTYTVSLKVKLADGTAGSPSARLVLDDGSYAWIGNTAISSASFSTITGTFTVAAGAAAPKIYIGTDGLAGAYTYLVDDILLTTPAGGGSTDPDPDPSFIPGGAVNPTTTPVTAAQGTGNVAALTFDDGPNGATTTALLDYLDENDITAVFCVIGQNIQAPGGAAILQRIVSEGHTLCNHSIDYNDMGSLTKAQATTIMKQNLQIIRDALGDPNAKVPFFRAPNGSWGANVAAAAVDLGMQPLGVVNTINDWSTQDVPTLTANLRAAIKPGEIVLTHDGGGNRSGTLAAVQTVVSERLADGWTFTLPVGALAAGNPSALTTDFESGLDGWTTRAAGGTPSVAITTTAAHGGSQAAIVTARSGQGDGLAHDATGLLVPGVTYHLDAWVKFAASQPVDDVWLSLASTTGTSTSYATLAQFTGMSNSSWVNISTDFTVGTADELLLYLETNYRGGAVGNTSDFLVDDITVTANETPVIEDLTGIKDTVDFPVGVAIDSRETSGAAAELLLRHFEQVTPENSMKPEAWYDSNGSFVTTNTEVDALMDFAQENDVAVYGHNMVWHSQTPAFFFESSPGVPLTSSPADQQILKDRMRTHIFAVAEYISDRYGKFGSATNPVYAFDVVNEVVSDSAEFDDGMRRSEWYRILGEQFVDLAFEYTNEALNGEYAAAGSDHPVTLFINDYNTEQGGKQARLKALVERLIERGVPVDGVGHQFHVSLAMPTSALESAIEAFEGLGLVQAVTELDVTTGTPVTESKLVDQGYYYRDVFRMLRAHADDIFSVTIWGLTDGRSWRATSGAPLVFNDGLQAKPAYYGIVDDELPAPQRSADVFEGSVEVGDVDNIAWAQLPLHQIDGDTAFQLRWEPDHLTAFVTVEDASVDATDSVEFAVGTSTYTVERDSDDVTERAGGYDLVAHLPLTGAAVGDLLQFDVRVSDDGTEVAWNSPGAMGTLNLVEPLSYLEIPEASSAPAIDATADAVWSEAADVTTSKLVTGTGGSTAVVHTLWKDDRLYVYAEVTDPNVDVSGSDPWIQDSIEVYVDPGNYKNGSYRYDDTQIRISAANVVSFGTGDEAFQRNRVTSATALTSTGYLVEASISLLEDGGLASFQGVDFQVNDATAGARSAIHNWADPTGAGYQSTARWGVARLVGGVATEPTVVLSLDEVRAGGTVRVDLFGFTEGDVVSFSLDEDGATGALGSGGGFGTFSTSVGRADLAQAVIGGTTIGPGGTASVMLTIPASTAPGSYTLSVLIGAVPVSTAQLVVLAALPGALAFTGSELARVVVIALMMLVAGGYFWYRRRASTLQFA